jgi:hypothetical protein
MEFIYAVLAHGVMRGTKRVVGALFRGVYAGGRMTRDGCSSGFAADGAVTSLGACGPRQELVNVGPDVVNRAPGNGRGRRIGITVES